MGWGGSGQEIFYACCDLLINVVTAIARSSAFDCKAHATV